MSGSSNWTDIPNGDIDQDSPATETLFTAMRDNINAQSWSYYDDGDGVIYDHAVSGNVSSIETPTFDDGYEYIFFLVDINRTGSSDISVEAYFDNDAAYGSPVSIAAIGASYHHVSFPRIGLGLLIVNGVILDTATDKTSKIDKLRFTVGAGEFSAGKFIMLRRHVSV